MSLHMANIWNAIAKAIPDKPAILYQDRQYSWKEYEGRAARLGQIFADNGLQPGSKLSIYSYNHPAWLDAQYGAFKAGLTPININYRYLENELIHVINNSDSQALVFQAQFAPRVAAIRDRLEQVKLFLEIDDGSGEHLEGALPYEETLAAADPIPETERPADDIYMLYTGGTTGMPKGVMYHQEDFATALLTIAFAMRGLNLPENPENFGLSARQLHDAGAAPRVIPACPLMHGTGMWIGAMLSHSLGGAVLLFDNKHYDPDVLCQLAQDEKATDIVIVGDVFAKPMVKALDAARAAGKPYQLDALQIIGSSGVMWSSDVKKGLLEHLDVTLIDSMGSTEGSMGSSVTTRETTESDQTAKFDMNATTKVFTEDDEEVAPGSGVIGFIANGGMVPLGYYKDEEKSAKTFREINGHRYSIPGDFATVEADGTITLLGRGSVCINSGGEKIFPEEVEEALKTHDSVYDCLVVGVPDDRFGEKVTAILSPADGNGIDEQALESHIREHIAAYKIPRSFLSVDQVPRADNGKPDYKGAKAMALKLLDMESV